MLEHRLGWSRQSHLPVHRPKASRPEIYNTDTKEWEYAHSLAAFDKEADRIDTAEAGAMAKKHGLS
jgi:hypothetical protein